MNLNVFSARRKGQPPEPGPDDLAARIADLSSAHTVGQDAFDGGYRRMRAAIAAHRREALGSPGRAPLRLFGARRLAAAGFLAAAMLALGAGALGLLTGTNGGLGIFDSPSAEAVVIQGTLEAQGTGELTLVTSSGTQVLAIESDLVIVDAVGNPIARDSLLKGQTLSVKGRREDHDRVVIHEIEATTEVQGRVVSFSAISLQLAGGRLEFVVKLTPETRFEGALKVGAQVEVEICPRCVRSACRHRGRSRRR